MAEDKENNVEAMEAALAKANEEAKNYRLEAKGLKEKLDTAQPFADKYMNLKAEYALSQRGIKNPERMVGLLKVESEDDLDAAIDTLEEQFPELFDPKAGVKSVDAADKGSEKTTRTATEMLTRQLLNR